MKKKNQQTKKLLDSRESSTFDDQQTASVSSDQIFDLLPYGSIILTAFINDKGFVNFKYSALNPATEKFTGHPPQYFYSKDFLKYPGIFPLHYISIFKEVWEKAISIEDDFTFQKSGKRKSIHVVIKKCEEGIVLFLNENTEEKLLLEKVEENENLTIQLKSQYSGQLQEFKDKIEHLYKINKDLENFVYTASHDLKSPMNNIEGLLNALYFELDSGNTEAKHIINLLQLSLDKFKTTLHDLSEIAQIQSKEEEEQLNDCYTLFEDVKFGIHDEIIKYGAIIESDFRDVPQILYSRNSLRSIITNLVTNALKYSTPQRRPEIKVKTVKEGNFIVLSVEDNGLGIKSGDTEKIFSAFKRIYTHVSGSGVGLYIVKRIVENNEGKIEVESVINKGSTFKIFIKDKSLMNKD